MGQQTDLRCDTLVQSEVRDKLVNVKKSQVRASFGKPNEIVGKPNGLTPLKEGRRDPATEIQNAECECRT